jgi:competence protein ComEC
VAEPWGLGIGAAVVLGALFGPVAVVIVPVTVVAFQILHGRRNLVFLSVMVMAVAVGAFRAGWVAQPDVPPDLAASTGATVEVTSLPRTSRSGESVLVAVREFEFEGHVRSGNGITALVWLPEGERATRGDTFSVSWSVEPLSMVGPGYGAYLESQGAVAVGRAWWISDRRDGPRPYHWLVGLRERVSTGLQEVLPGDTGALASGIVTGDDSGLSDRARDAFLHTGTSHITAVSGANVAMILALWNLCIPAGRNRRLLAVQVTIIVSIWLYAIVVGLEPPALRAAVMASLVLLASRFGRRPDLLTILALTSAGMVLWNPGHVRMVAFWLSIVATAAIVMRVPNDAELGGRGMLRGMIEGVVLAQIATLPIILSVFGTWSLTSVLANGLLAPLTWLAFPLCFLLALVVAIVPPIAPIVAIAPLIPLRVSLEIVGLLGSGMPPLNVDNSGVAGIVVVALPCLLALVLLSADSRRWEPILSEQVRTRPVAFAVAVIGPVTGCLVGILIFLVRA